MDAGLRVDLVFTDVGMPEMDGVTLAHLIGRRLPGLPVALVTGRPDVVDPVTERGDIALLKPYSLEPLEALLNEHFWWKAPEHHQKHRRRWRDARA